MAIDTRDRRSSAIMVGLPWRGQYPNPDAGAENQADRQHVGLMYRGILAGGAAPPAAAAPRYVGFLRDVGLVGRI